MTLAPELPGAIELIEWLTAEGVIVAIGHTDASWQQADDAIRAGARLGVQAGGVRALVRRPRGRDIFAACGQLAARGAEKVVTAPN